MWLTPAGWLCLKQGSSKTHFLIVYYIKSYCSVILENPKRWFKNSLLPLPAVLSIWARLHVSSGLLGFQVGKRGTTFFFFCQQFIFPACVKASRSNRNTLRLVYTTPINNINRVNTTTYICCLLGWRELVCLIAGHQLLLVFSKGREFEALGSQLAKSVRTYRRILTCS